jgi:hypothetical protein
MRGNSDVLFSNIDLAGTLEKAQQKMKEAVETYDANKLLNTSADDLVAYFADNASIDQLVLNEAGTTISQEEAQYDVTHDYRYAGFPGEGRRTVPATRTSFFVPFTGERDLFRCRASTFTFSPPSAEISEHDVIVSITDPQPDGGRARQQFESVMREIRQHVGWVNSQVDGYNQSLLGVARQAMEARRKRLLDARQAVSAIGFPVRQRANAPATYAVPSVRRRVPPPAPAKTGPADLEPALPNEEYERILEIIENMVLVMERSPAAFKGMKEEDLRQHFLVQLNGQYEGSATGETFNMSGKTDILIRQDGKNIFIAECKFWEGPVKFTETITQLLGYVSWRDAKAAVLVFNRNKNFSAVVGQIPALVRAHSSFKRELPVNGETRFRAVLGQPNDPARELVLTVAAFDVPAEA